MILNSIGAAFGQLDDAKFIFVVLKSLGLTILSLILVTMGLQWLIPDSISLPWIGEIAWFGRIADRAVIFAMIGASVFVMIPIATVVIGFFLEEVSEAVEDKHYPSAKPTTRLGFGPGFIEAVQFLGLWLIVNLFALIFYIIFAPLAPLIFILVNGVLLGREYAQLVAMRHVGRQGARKFRARNRPTIWIAGVLMAVPLLIPIVNLLVPVLGVATYTHLFHKLKLDA